MTRKQKNFCDEWILNGGNAAAAARSAGYSAHGAKVAGSRLLGRQDIRREIDDRLDKFRSERVADERELLEIFTSIARGEVQDELSTPSGKVVTVRVNSSTRLKAAETLAKIFGMFRRSDEIESTPSGAELFVRTLEQVWQNIESESAT